MNQYTVLEIEGYIMRKKNWKYEEKSCENKIIYKYSQIGKFLFLLKETLWKYLKI